MNVTAKQVIYIAMENQIVYLELTNVSAMKITKEQIQVSERRLILPKNQGRVVGSSLLSLPN